jgi:hypothetical protein
MAENGEEKSPVARLEDDKGSFTLSEGGAKVKPSKDATKGGHHDRH